MNVSQLRELLLDFDQDADVVVYTTDGQERPMARVAQTITEGEQPLVVIYG